MDSTAVFSDDGKNCGYGGTCENSDRVRGVCPAGWHLPDSSEFGILLSAVGGAGEAGIVLKASSGWEFNRESDNGTDDFGFSALPYEASNASHSQAIFWSASWRIGSVANYMRISFGSDYVNGSSFTGKIFEFSVRCLKD